jgi:hypothetical protein
VQITAARHAVKIDCGVSVADVGNTCCVILVMVGDRARKSGNTVLRNAGVNQKDTMSTVQVHR